MFASGETNAYPDLTISNDCSVAEGTGVAVSSPLESLSWRLHVQEAGGTRVKSEWVRVFHRCDATRRGRIASHDLVPHAEQLNLGACNGDLNTLTNLQGTFARLDTELPLVSDGGLLVQESAGVDTKRSPPISPVSWVHAPGNTNPISQCSTRASTADGPRIKPDIAHTTTSFEPNPKSTVSRDLSKDLESSFCQSLVSRSTNQALTVGLVYASPKKYRGEILACRNEANPSKVRGLGLAWRSDGLLLAQRLDADGEPILWTGRSSSYSVGDVLDIVPLPLTGSLKLFVNGRRVASFLEGSLPVMQPYRLAVRLERARIRIERQLEPVVASKSDRRATNLSDTFPVCVLPQEVNNMPAIREEAARLQTLRDHQYRTSPRDRHSKVNDHNLSAKKAWVEYWPPTIQPGVGVKLVTQRSERDQQQMAAVLKARIADNAARRASSARARREGV